MVARAGATQAETAVGKLALIFTFLRYNAHDRYLKAKPW